MRPHLVSHLFWVALVWGLLQVSAGSADTMLRRLDPHGAKNLTLSIKTIGTHNECRVCHDESTSAKLLLKKGAADTCVNCHGNDPHSGTAEHRVHAVRCIDCHSPHRASAIPSPEQVDGKSESPLSRFLQVDPPKLGEDQVIRKSHFPMLKKRCEDCHRWK